MTNLPSRSLAALFDLGGQVALVTGGSRGLGLQIAEALGEYGARIVLAARRTADLDAAVTHLGALGIAVDAIACDLATPDAADALVAQVMQQWGRLDILVNNAGTSWGAPMEDYPLAGWQKVIDLNLTGLFLLTQAAGRRAFLPQGHGKVLNIASVAGLQGNYPGMIGTIAYNTAKGGVINFTRALAAEWGPRHINVNAIAPGYFPSRLADAMIEAHGDMIIAHTPLGRLGGEDDLKGAALLLVSAAGRHITGQVLVIDGGAAVI
ncbi:SDR family oxidoreductase [Luteimonas sp. S4-F44]|uniref:SDR family oxidoreductase n=1 Tax=Luteimonas sp. S4-F44 TaxID=2925842 RepID=UPI001F53CF32|nr:SDR family oxidoreductase [Luteimonas sp. S4-F44]UNK43611.1 SDR family oxidoreductase [Luteimonas sp. S4-F44]